MLRIRFPYRQRVCGVRASLRQHAYRNRAGLRRAPRFATVRGETRDDFELPKEQRRPIVGMRTETELAAAMQVGRLFAGDGAATRGELVVEYQPVFQTGSQRITAVEVPGPIGARRTWCPSCCRRFRNRLFISGLPRSVPDRLPENRGSAVLGCSRGWLDKPSASPRRNCNAAPHLRVEPRPHQYFKIDLR
jgi:hypothetical protein